MFYFVLKESLRLYDELSVWFILFYYVLNGSLVTIRIILYFYDI
jgi:hypothetical protein